MYKLSLDERKVELVDAIEVYQSNLESADISVMALDCCYGDVYIYIHWIHIVLYGTCGVVSVCV